MKFTKMNKIVLLFFLILTFNFCIESRKLTDLKTQHGASCAIDINRDLPDPQPLLVNPGTNKSILPNSFDGFVKLTERQEIELFCTEGFEKIFGSKPLQATCSRGTLLKIQGKDYNIQDIKCQRSSKAHTEEVGKCYRNSSLIHIGYKIESRFIKLIDICFDKQKQRTLYAHAKLTKANAAHQKNVDRGSWTSGNKFFSIKNVNKLYSFENQLERAKLFLGRSQANKFINKKVNLARGHLAPMVDFIYGVHQRATMTLLNAAPQYNTINGGNWFRIEESIRDLVEKGNVGELDVYSGTYETLDINSKKFYLAKNAKQEDVLPVPKVFYKIIIDRGSTKGVALVMTNDPFVDQKSVRKYVYCKDVSQKVKWVRKMKPELSKGYYYACEVDEFVRKVEHLPNEVRVNGLLTG